MTVRRLGMAGSSGTGSVSTSPIARAAHSATVWVTPELESIARPLVAVVVAAAWVTEVELESEIPAVAKPVAVVWVAAELALRVWPTVEPVVATDWVTPDEPESEMPVVAADVATVWVTAEVASTSTGAAGA